MKNGKKVCNELKRVRKQIADANDIVYTPTECNHKGDCKGTCPACEAEVRYLENQLNLRSMLGKAVVVAGLGLTVASCFPGGGERGSVPNQSIDTVYELEGDVIAEIDSTTLPDSINVEDINK